MCVEIPRSSSVAALGPRGPRRKADLTDRLGATAGRRGGVGDLEGQREDAAQAPSPTIPSRYSRKVKNKRKA